MGKSSLSVGMQAWIEKINGAWRASAASVVDCGRFLIECKAVVPAGDFQRMVKSQLDFSPSMARKFMAIAGDQRLLRRAHGNALPKHWTTLYELHQLPDDDLDRVLTDAKQVKREDIKQLRAPKVTPSADEADTPARTATLAVPGSAVPEQVASPVVGAADRHEGGDSDDPIVDLDQASVFDNEPSSPSAVAVALNPISAAIEFAKRVSVDDFFADLDVTIAHEDVYGFSNWILELEDLVKAAKQIEEAEAAA